MVGKITTFFLTLLLASVSLFGLVDASNFLKGRMYFFTLCYIALAGLLWRIKYTRIIAFILAILWAVNSSLSILIYQLYQGQLNYQLATTILSTNVQESQDFIFAHWSILLIALSLLLGFMFITFRLSSLVSKRNLIVLSSIILLTVIYKFSESALKGRLSDPSFNMIEKVLPYTSLNNFAVLGRAYQELNLLNTVSNYKPIYQLDTDETNIDTYVIVVGESVRRDHLSLYGYARDTTPYIDKQKSNLFIFGQAIAPAPMTSMSLASILTIKASDDSSPSLLNDNILNIANKVGFETYWFSRQNSIGQFETAVTSIAKSANHKEWLLSGYDDALLVKLDEALKANGKKKLIVLHTNGSHLSACHQYPAEDSYFVNGGSEYENCYDNSILFMDKLLNNIFKRLENTSASVLYFSDHGQMKRIKRGEVDYFHGSINPTKESLDIPQFIWYSPIINSKDKKIGSYNIPYSAANNYYLIANWLGINKNNGIEISSPLSADYQADDKIIIMDTQLNLFDYQQLPSDNNLH
ncbi:phosphoethanolamine transferase [Orbus sturtevantii]|uniref:phosphoethanolamine transferase n=1 Tax=Orbus sturtevantii TaxID=3074109 RepID=UPI00370DBF6A